MILPDAEWRKRAGLDALIATLGGASDARFVGGVVRDGLLGLPVADIDVATRLTPPAVLERLRDGGIRAVPTGLAHGTITAVLESGPVEITTLRRDVATDGRHALVAFTGDWHEDASRRDFTMNALYADPESGEVHDYFDGLADLAAGHVRFIGDPLRRIAEDHLRILRFFRFHARFGAADQRTIDTPGLAACAARANDLMALSRERIAGELLRLLVARHAVPVVALMIERGILAAVLPEITDAAPLARLVEREQQAGIVPDPIRRFAALLGRDAVMAEQVGARLKLSNQQRRRLSLAADPSADASPRALAYRLGVEAATDALLLADRPLSDLADLAGWQVPRLPITGGAVIARGLRAGPAVARVLRRIEERWIAEGFPPIERVENIADAEAARALGETSGT